MKKQQRQGSIPLVMLVVMVLAAGAGASLFLSQSTARMEYRFGLKTQASALAQSAVEEVLVRLQNGSAGWDSDMAARFAFNANSTQAVADVLAEKDIAVTIHPVEVMGRLAEAPNDPAAAADFNRLMQLGPYFDSDSLKAKMGGNIGRWSEDIVNQPWYEANLIAIGNKPLEQYLQEDLPPAGNLEDIQYQGIGNYLNKYSNYWDRDPGQFDENTGNRVAEEFAALNGGTEPGALPVVTDWRNLSDDPSTIDGTRTTALNAFADQWTKAMEAVGEHVQNRVDGCDGDQRYGLGALFSSFVLDGPADNNADEEEAFVETSDEQLEYKSHLVSLATEVEIEAAGVKTRQQYQAHRLVSSMNATAAVSKMRDQTMLYMMYLYNFTPQDLLWLQANREEFANSFQISKAADGSWTMKSMPGLHGPLYNRHGDLSGKRISSLGTSCLAKTRES